MTYSWKSAANKQYKKFLDVSKKNVSKEEYYKLIIQYFRTHFPDAYSPYPAFIDLDDFPGALHRHQIELMGATNSLPPNRGDKLQWKEPIINIRILCQDETAITGTCTQIFYDVIAQPLVSNNTLIYIPWTNIKELSVVKNKDDDNAKNTL